MVDLRAVLGRRGSQRGLVLERPGGGRHGAPVRADRPAAATVLSAGEVGVRLLRAALAAALLGLVPTESAEGQTAAPNTLASRTKGAPGAPITVYEMSDFQC